MNATIIIANMKIFIDDSGIRKETIESEKRIDTKTLDRNGALIMHEFFEKENKRAYK